MSKNRYDVELSESDMQVFDNINTTEALQPQETTTSHDVVTDVATEQQTGETSQEATESQEVDANSVMIDGESYDLDTIKTLMDDSSNKENWQKSNTEKAQELAKWNKFAEKLESDDEFREHIKDYFFDDKSQIEKLGLDGKFPGETLNEEEVIETKSDLETRLQYLEDAEGERVVEQNLTQLDMQLKGLEDKFPDYLEGEKLNDFLDFVLESGETYLEGSVPNLNKAFRNWSYDAMQSELNHYKKLDDNRNRNHGRVVNPSTKSVQETKTPQKYKSFKEISLDNPEVAKYFNE